MKEIGRPPEMNSAREVIRRPHFRPARSGRVSSAPATREADHVLGELLVREAWSTGALQDALRRKVRGEPERALALGRARVRVRARERDGVRRAAPRSRLDVQPVLLTLFKHTASR